MFEHREILLRTNDYLLFINFCGTWWRFGRVDAFRPKGQWPIYITICFLICLLDNRIIHDYASIYVTYYIIGIWYNADALYTCIWVYIIMYTT